jgi:uncharacterized delta-60 repeat protein
MSIPGTVPFTGLIAPTATSDTYAITDPIYGKDGLRSVPTLADRDAISAERRRQGMIVFTQSDGKYWSLGANLTTWTEFVGGGGGGASTADAITYQGTTSGLTATNVQTALDEITVIAAMATPGDTGTWLISGGGITWVSGYVFDVAAARYYVVGKIYNSPPTRVTLSPADPTYDRFDNITVNNLGSVVVVEGMASPTPAVPAVDPQTTLVLSHVRVDAASVTPTTITSRLIYDEAVGPPTEWASTMSNATINLISTSNPYSGTKDVEATSAANNHYFQFQSATSLDVTTYETLVFAIRVKAAWGTKSLVIGFRTAGGAIGNTVALVNGQYGFTTADTVNYQKISIPITQFGVSAGTLAQVLRFTVTGGGATIGFYFDACALQGGTGLVGTATGLTQSQADARYLRQAANLADVASAPASRTNLGLTPIATSTVGAGLSLTGGVLSATGGASGNIAYTDAANVFVEAPQTIIVDDDAHAGVVVTPHSTKQTAKSVDVQHVVPNILTRSDVNSGKGDFTEGDAVLVQSDGKILVVGNDIDVSGVVARYDAYGKAYDPDWFYGDRLTVRYLGSNNTYFSTGAIDAAGNVVVAGNASDAGLGLWMLWRFLPNGDVDPAFNGGDVVTTPVNAGTNYNGTPKKVKVQSDGKIVLTGLSSNASNQIQPTVVRYNSDGSLDVTGFGTGGIARVAITGNADTRGLGIQADGKIVISGGEDFLTIRLNGDGTVDTGFATAGIFTDPAIGGSGADLVLQPDGKIVVSGTAQAVSNYQTTVIRLTTVGVLDSSFGTGGKASVAILGDDNYSSGDVVSIQSDNKLVVAGYTQDYNHDYDNAFAVARFTTGGVLDVTFGVGGSLSFQVNADSTSDMVYGIAIQADDKVLLTGYDGDNNQMATVRLNSDGSFDHGFGSATALAVDAYGNTTVGGTLTTRGFKMPKLDGSNIYGYGLIADEYGTGTWQPVAPYPQSPEGAVQFYQGGNLGGDGKLIWDNSLDSLKVGDANILTGHSCTASGTENISGMVPIHFDLTGGVNLSIPGDVRTYFPSNNVVINPHQTPQYTTINSPLTFSGGVTTFTIAATTTGSWISCLDYVIAGHAEGSGTFAGGPYSHAQNKSNMANAFASSAAGNGSLASVPTQWALSGGGAQQHFSSDWNPVGYGEAQRSMICMCVQTIGTATGVMRITTDANGLTYLNGVPIRPHYTYGFTVTVLGTTGGGNPNGMFTRQGIIKNVAGTTTLVGSVSTVGFDNNPAGWVLTISADDVNDMLKISVNAPAGGVIHWVASVDLLEVIFN